VATSGEKRWPPVGKFVAAVGENSMAIDMRLSVRPDFPGLCGRFPGEKAHDLARLPFRHARRSTRPRVRGACELAPMLRRSFPRRQQYRRVHRAAAGGGAGLAAGAFAVLAARRRPPGGCGCALVDHVRAADACSSLVVPRWPEPCRRDHRVVGDKLLEHEKLGDRKGLRSVKGTNDSSAVVTAAVSSLRAVGADASRAAVRLRLKQP